MWASHFQISRFRSNSILHVLVPCNPRKRFLGRCGEVTGALCLLQVMRHLSHVGKLTYNMKPQLMLHSRATSPASRKFRRSILVSGAASHIARPWCRAIDRVSWETTRRAYIAPAVRHPEWYFTAWSTVVPMEVQLCPLPAFLQNSGAEHFPSMSSARRACRRSQVLVNNKTADCSTNVSSGDFITWMLHNSKKTGGNSSDECKRERVAELVKNVTVLYEDDTLLAFAKPVGVLCHPAHDIGEITMQDLGLELGAVGAVHRLDRETSGVMLFAKAAEAIPILQASWDDKACTVKEYVALVRGEPQQKTWIVDTPLARLCIAGDKGRKKKSEKRREQLEANPDSGRHVTGDAWAPKPAATLFRCIGQMNSGRASLIHCQLEEGGRTHQIRRHLEMSGHNVVGDSIYGHGQTNNYMRTRFGSSRLFLHAWRLGIRHPVSEATIVLEDPLPPDIVHMIGQLDGGSEVLQRLESWQ
eukprot:TRINITY_DN59443_c0_g1_i1.p1 TRINITY_DN59443_c0_g1~~TRINITY_DN59443_c0_g1_i1.p1  ORF type:complete len:472 (+),score=47.54 TRINITY_DN59443_c0_g1_i1:130-1545(+)